jgi:hypothetical protein
LHVVVVDAVLIAVTFKKVDGVHAGPILEVNAAFRKYLLHCVDKLIYEGEQLLGRWPGLAHSQVQRIVQVLLVVRARVDIHGKQVLRRHAGAGGV